MRDDAEVSVAGRPLLEWVLDLTSHDRAVREAAGKALQATRIGVSNNELANSAAARIEEPHEVSVDAITAAWREMIGRVFLTPGFPGGATAIYLARRLMAIHAALIQKCERGQFDFQNDESITAATMAARWVLECVGPGGSDVVPTLIEMLDADGGSQAYLAADALASIGTPARSALPALIEAVRRRGVDENPYRIGIALAAIAGGDQTTVQTLTDLVSAPEMAARQGACAALREFGTRAASAIPALIAATRHADAETRSLAAIALSTVGEGRPDIVDVLLPLTKDAAWFVRGNAIGSLGRLGLRLPEVVPVVIAALDDPGGDGDWSVREQVLDALARAGAAAAPAVTKLCAKLKDEDGEIDEDVVRTLGELSTVAKDALPQLYDLLQYAELDGQGEDVIAETIERIETAA